MTRCELIRHIAERYSTDPEYPWGDGNCIFRHGGNRKWFALCMRIPYARLGLAREGETDVVNLKCAPQLMGAYRRLPGVFPGYHMNKDHWLSVLLDGSAAESLIKELLELSFDLTDTRRRKKRLSRYADCPVRILTDDGRVFEGVAESCSAEYGLHEFGREEESLALGAYQLFAGEIVSIEPLSRDALCGFSGAEGAPPALRELYRRLKGLWCAETCAPRLRERWTPENPSLGQCSITAFLVQELFGGRVCGIPLGDGNFHCYNVFGDEAFDLTSEQFIDRELDYDNANEQSREAHFAKEEKRQRYELLKAKLEALRSQG